VVHIRSICERVAIDCKREGVVNILGQEVLDYTLEAANKIEAMVTAVSVNAPKFNGSEEKSSASNSLDDNFIKSLKNGEHLETSYLASYYKDLAEA